MSDMAKRLRGPIAEAAQAYTDAWFNNPDTKRPVHCIPAKETDTDLTLAIGIKDAANHIEEIEQKLSKSLAALEAICEGEPDPNTLSELIWCKDRAQNVLEEIRQKS